MTNVFVVNSGSSSIKYQLIDVESESTLASGLIDRIGEPNGEATDHEDAMRIVLDRLGSSPTVAAVGHRVVQGGSRFIAPTLIDDSVTHAIAELSALAPLHNPANVEGIRAAQAAFPDVSHVAIFDTAFHQTLSPAAYTYAIDPELAEQYGVRRYGFHGTSHKYVSEQAAAFLGRPLDELNQIVLHLGNGASMCAVRGGLSIETSMGMTPLEGLVMGTRSGDIDPAALFHLHRQAGMDVAELDELLNRKSGLLGMTGTRDMRDVTSAAEQGGDAASLALDVYCHRIRHYVGAYLAQLGRVDTIVFTAGVGENSAIVRSRALVGLEGLGISVDPVRNGEHSRDPRLISPDGAAVAVLVIPTNEELEIARQTLDAIR